MLLPICKIYSLSFLTHICYLSCHRCWFNKHKFSYTFPFIWCSNSSRDRNSMAFNPGLWNAFAWGLKNHQVLPSQHPRDSYIPVIEWSVLLRLTGWSPRSQVLLVGHPPGILLKWCLEEYAQRFWTQGQIATLILYFDLILLLGARPSR